MFRQGVRYPRGDLARIYIAQREALLKAEGLVDGLLI
jgi:hypothetical protein